MLLFFFPKTTAARFAFFILSLLPMAEAGGIVTDAAGNDLDFSKGRFLDLDTGIIATNKELMPSLLKAVQEAIKEKNQAASLL